MLLILTLILALVFLPWPWNAAAVVIAVVWEVSGAVLSIRYSRRDRAWVGVETLVGKTGSVITPLTPEGQVKVDGEIWQARSRHGASVGETVLVTAVDRLTLDVEPASLGAVASSSRAWSKPSGTR